MLRTSESTLVHPQVVTYNTVMSACEKGRDYDAADRVFSEMCKWAALMKNAVRSRLFQSVLMS